MSIVGAGVAAVFYEVNMADEPITERMLKEQLQEHIKPMLEPMTRNLSDLNDGIKELRGEFKEIKKVVTGNGTGIGIDEQARNNRRDIDEMEQKIKKIDEISSTVNLLKEKSDAIYKVLWLILSAALAWSLVATLEHVFLP